MDDDTEEIVDLGERLRVLATRWAQKSGYDDETATQLREELARRCHQRYRRTIPAYRRLCDDCALGDDAPLTDILASCAISDGWFKSYDAACLERGDFGAMNEWLRDVAAVEPAENAARATGVDDWLARLAEGGVEVLYSSGTSGKLSFVPRDESTWMAYRGNGPCYLMQRVFDLSIDLGAVEGVVLGFAGGRMGIQRAGIELARFVEKVSFLYDFEIRADMLRAALTARDAETALRARATIGAGSEEGRARAYQVVLGTLARASAEGRPVYLFGAPYQVAQLCVLARAERLAPLPPGSVVNLGGGWKSFEGERVDAAELARRIEESLGVPRARHLEAYAMVELNSPLMRCDHGRFHVPPLLTPVLFDEALVPLDVEEGAGTFGFVDPTALSYPGFLVTGDRVQLSRVPCECGLVGPTLRGEVRRAPGREVRGCGGIMATVRA